MLSRYDALQILIMKSNEDYLSIASNYSLDIILEALEEKILSEDAFCHVLEALEEINYLISNLS